MKKLLFLICLSVSFVSYSQYDEIEQDMIDTYKQYIVTDTKLPVKKFETEGVVFWYRQSGNKVTGELIVNGIVNQVYGLYTGEGTYFASVWYNGKSVGVMDWDFSNSCTTIINKTNSKTFYTEVCSVNY